MADKWQPVVDLLQHMVRDRDLMLRWGLQEYGDVRSEDGQAWLVHWKREDLKQLIAALQTRRDADA